MASLHYIDMPDDDLLALRDRLLEAKEVPIQSTGSGQQQHTLQRRDIDKQLDDVMVELISRGLSKATLDDLNPVVGVQSSDPAYWRC